MLALERQKKILEILERDGAVMVSKLSAELSVTDETVRRDLEKLEAREMLRRTHGGALPLEGGSYEPSLEKRKNLNVDSKKAIAYRAVGFIASGDSVFLDASTTTFYMAKEIKNMKNVTVITNSLRVINELSGVEGIKVIAIGGMVSNNQSLVGATAENYITDHYFADKMFFSSRGIDGEIGIMEGNEQEGHIKQKMLKNSRAHFYLCDKSKVGKVGHMKLAAFDELDYLITDAKLSNEVLGVMQESGVEVVKA